MFSDQHLTLHVMWNRHLSYVGFHISVTHLLNNLPQSQLCIRPQSRDESSPEQMCIKLDLGQHHKSEIRFTGECHRKPTSHCYSLNSIMPPGTNVFQSTGHNRRLPGPGQWSWGGVQAESSQQIPAVYRAGFPGSLSHLHGKRQMRRWIFVIIFAPEWEQSIEQILPLV